VTQNDPKMTYFSHIQVLSPSVLGLADEFLPKNHFELIHLLLLAKLNGLKRFLGGRKSLVFGALRRLFQDAIVSSSATIALGV
jgi:hypothetical protein